MVNLIGFLLKLLLSLLVLLMSSMAASGVLTDSGQEEVVTAVTCDRRDSTSV